MKPATNRSFPAAALFLGLISSAQAGVLLLVPAAPAQAASDRASVPAVLAVTDLDRRAAAVPEVALDADRDYDRGRDYDRD